MKRSLYSRPAWSAVPAPSHQKNKKTRKRKKKLKIVLRLTFLFWARALGKAHFFVLRFSREKTLSLRWKCAHSEGCLGPPRPRSSHRKGSTFFEAQTFTNKSESFLVSVQFFQADVFFFVSYLLSAEQAGTAGTNRTGGGLLCDPVSELSRGGHIKQDLRYTQKPTRFAIFTNSIWSYLLRSPVISGGREKRRGQHSLLRGAIVNRTYGIHNNLYI